MTEIRPQPDGPEAEVRLTVCHRKAIGVDRCNWAGQHRHVAGQTDGLLGPGFKRFEQLQSAKGNEAGIHIEDFDAIH